MSWNDFSKVTPPSEVRLYMVTNLPKAEISPEVEPVIATWNFTSVRKEGSSKFEKKWGFFRHGDPFEASHWSEFLSTEVE